MDNRVVALVVARPGRLRDGWRALLLATGPIARVSLADDTSMAMCLAGALSPKLALVDMEAFGSEALALLVQIKAQHPTCRCVALTHDSWEPRRAQSAGADAALVKGFPAAGLFETIRQLLQASEPDSE
jgi:DNA-binding NarL/FixJ family response regulator